MTPESHGTFPFLKIPAVTVFISIKLDIISQMVRFCFDNSQHSMRFQDLIIGVQWYSLVLGIRFNYPVRTRIQ